MSHSCITHVYIYTRTVNIFTHIQMRTCIDNHTYTHINFRLHTRAKSTTHAQIYINSCTLMHIRLNTHTCIYLLLYTRTQIYIHPHTLMHVGLYTHKHIYLPACAHTQSNIQPHTHSHTITQSHPSATLLKQFQCCTLGFLSDYSA